VRVHVSVAVVQRITRSLALAAAIAVGVVGSGCGSPPPSQSTLLRVQAAAETAGLDTVQALGLSRLQTSGATRATVCADSLGRSTSEAFGEYSTVLAAGIVTGSDVDALPAALNITFFEDFTSRGITEPDTRQVSFTLRADDIDVRVTVRLPTGGDVSVKAETACT
jgi:hypothetical protein